MEKQLNKDSIIAGGNNVDASKAKRNSALRDFYSNYIAAANARDYDAIANVVAENVILNGVPVKREDIITEFKGLIGAAPDFYWQVLDLVVEEDRIAARLRDTGTPKAETFFGQNLKGNSVTFTEFGSYKVRDGLFVEMNYLIDVPAISQQLQK